MTQPSPTPHETEPDGTGVPATATPASAEPAGPRPEYHLMAVTTARVEENRRNSGRPHAGWLAAVRTGLVAVGEVPALSATGAYTAALSSDSQKAGARRAAAIRATHKDCRPHRGQRGDSEPSSPRKGLGRSLAELHRAENRGQHPDDRTVNQIVGQVNALPLLDRDNAALVLHQLLGRCTGAGVPVDFFDLARSLIHWGNGVSPHSQAVRRRIVSDFYGSRNA